MLSQFVQGNVGENTVATVIISIALMLFLGFSMTRLTKKLRLPNVTAYIITGILIGPYCLDLIPRTVIDGMDFLSDIALAFIAFSTGEFFRLSTLRKNGMKSDYRSAAHPGLHCLHRGNWIAVSISDGSKQNPASVWFRKTAGRL